MPTAQASWGVGLTGRARRDFYTTQEFCLAAFQIKAWSDHYDRVTWFVEQCDRRDGGIPWRRVLKFLELRSFGEAEKAFCPFKIWGQCLHPTEESFEIQRARKANGRGYGMVRCPCGRGG